LNKRGVLSKRPQLIASLDQCIRGQDVKDKSTSTVPFTFFRYNCCPHILSLTSGECDMRAYEQIAVVGCHTEESELNVCLTERSKHKKGGMLKPVLH
jgi:hypothetical protein